jgi:membrane protein
MAEEKQAKLQQLQKQMRQLLDDDAVAEHEQALNWSQRFIHFWILTGQSFLKNRAPVRAASLAYTTLLALVPLLAVSISVAALLLPRDPNEQKRELFLMIDGAVEKFAPSLGVSAGTGDETEAMAHRAQLAEKIVEFVGNIRFGTIGATALAGLILVAIGLLRTVEATFNDMWGVTKGRGWLMSIAVYWAVVTLGPIVVLVIKGANYLQVLSNSTQTWLPGGVLGQMLLSLAWVPALAVASVAFGALYLWMPNTRVRWSSALVGGFVAAALWMLNGQMAALYNTRVLTNNAIYGSLGVLPLFLFGLYLSWLILLFGAQVAYVFQFRKAYLQERQAGRVHQQGREFVALRLMTELGRRFAAGTKPATVAQLAELFGIPPKLAKETLQALVAARLLVETQSTSTETAYSPARPLAQIAVRDVLRALRAGQGNDMLTNEDEARAAVREEFQAVLAAEDSRAGAVSLEQLVARVPARS